MPGHDTPHDEARDEVWEELVTVLMDEGEDISPELFRNFLLEDGELLATFNRAWPLLDATDVVGDL